MESKSQGVTWQGRGKRSMSNHFLGPRLGLWRCCVYGSFGRAGASRALLPGKEAVAPWMLPSQGGSCFWGCGVIFTQDRTGSWWICPSPSFMPPPSMLQRGWELPSEHYFCIGWKREGEAYATCTVHLKQWLMLLIKKQICNVDSKQHQPTARHCTQYPPRGEDQSKPQCY